MFWTLNQTSTKSHFSKKCLYYFGLICVLLPFIVGIMEGKMVQWITLTSPASMTARLICESCLEYRIGLNDCMAKMWLWLWLRLWIQFYKCNCSTSLNFDLCFFIHQGWQKGAIWGLLLVPVCSPKGNNRRGSWTIIPWHLGLYLLPKTITDGDNSLNMLIQVRPFTLHRHWTSVVIKIFNRAALK